MDRNQIIGIVMITGIMAIYLMFFSPDEKKIAEVQNTKPAVSNTIQKTDKDTSVQKAIPDSLLNKEFGAKYGVLAPGAQGEAKDMVLENKDIKVTLSTFGGKIKQVELKNYSSFTDYEKGNGKDIALITEKNSTINLISTINNKEVDLSQLYYLSSVTQKEKLKVVSFKLDAGEGRSVEQIYSLGEEGFTLSYSLRINGLDVNKPLNLVWKENPESFERGLDQNRKATTINYYTTDDSFDQLSETSDEEEKAEVSNLKWVAMKQKFFNTGIIAENKFEKGEVKSNVNIADTTVLKDMQAMLLIPADDVKNGKGKFTFFFGPNHYNTCKNITDGYEKNIYLGWPVINVINRFIVIPVFNFFETFISDYGLIIIILVILLKLVLFPLSWKSYISMAKMRVMKPELDEIKEKHGEDQQKVQSEQMLLYQKVGINPLSGCIPVLLQMPIILAMFNFFPNSIELRQQSFLWAPDLSTYDAIITWNGNIPLITWALGNHLSLFTVLMTLSTLVYTWFNNQVSTVTGPMKSVSYLMPVVFLFVLNSFPAGLSFYYFVSNIVSILQQIIIKRFVDEGQIRAQLDENRQKISTGQVKKNRFMARLEDAMKQQEAVKQQTKKKK